MARRKNINNVVAQAVSLEEEVLEKDREIVFLKTTISRLEKNYSRLQREKEKSDIKYEDKMKKLCVITTLSFWIAVVAVFMQNI